MSIGIKRNNPVYEFSAFVSVLVCVLVCVCVCVSSTSVKSILGYIKHFSTESSVQGPQHEGSSNIL